jgi:L-rhamnose mutarotase
MSKQRTLWLDRLKAESIPEYIRMHQQVWPELEAAYRQAGILKMGCYLHGCERVVFIEYETEIYNQAKASLDSNPIEIRWQALMKTFCDPQVERLSLTEVYYLSQNSTQ